VINGKNMSNTSGQIVPGRIEIPWMGYRSHHRYFVQELGDNNIGVQTLTYPRDCFDYLTKTTPKLIISSTDFDGSVGLPREGGWENSGEIALEVLKLVRKMPNQTNTPILALNSWGKDMGERLAEIGCEVLNINDFRPSNLAELIKRKLR
jgi:hypothetical protein